MYRVRSERRSFDNPDAMAEALPGGVYGILPLDKGPFGASLRITELGPDFLLRAVNTSSAVAIRSELTERWPAVAYFLPTLDGGPTLFDGHEVGDDTIASRIVGHTPTMRTYASNEIANFAISVDTLEKAAEILVGRSGKSPLVTPTTIIKTRVINTARLGALHRLTEEILGQYAPDEAGDFDLPPFALIRDEMLATIVQGLAGDRARPDHRARQLQTRSMARIDRFIDEHAKALIGLQDLCAGVNLSLRTVETIIRSRTGMPALVYLRRRRLALVRDMLEHASRGTTVTSAAFQFGFWHLSRFSQYYRQTYGELPSTTLSNSLGRA